MTALDRPSCFVVQTENQRTRHSRWSSRIPGADPSFPTDHAADPANGVAADPSPWAGSSAAGRTTARTSASARPSPSSSTTRKARSRWPTLSRESLTNTTVSVSTTLLFLTVFSFNWFLGWCKTTQISTQVFWINWRVVTVARIWVTCQIIRYCAATLEMKQDQLTQTCFQLAGTNTFA